MKAEAPSIVPAQPEHLQAILQLCGLHAAFEREVYSKQSGSGVPKKELLAKLLFDAAPAMHCLVVEQGAEVVGYATYMRQYSTWDAAHYLYLDCLYLCEEARGMGLGRRLMEKVRSEALQMGASQIQWQTPDFNADAIAFYERLGATSKAKARFGWQLEANLP